MATASRFNRGYSGGLAAGSQAGGGFQSSFQSSFQNNTPTESQSGGRLVPGLNGSMVWQKNADPNAAALDTQPATPALPPPPPTPSPSMAAPDMGNFFSAPLPTLGSSQPMKQQPPSPFGPAPLPFGGARANGGPVMPGRAYLVGERGPEMVVPQQPGMVIPNEALRSGALSSRPAVPVGRGMTPERRMQTWRNRAWTQGNEQAAQAIDQSMFNAQMFGRGSRAAMPMPAPMPMMRAPLPPMPAPPPAAMPMPEPAPLPPAAPAQAQAMQPDVTNPLLFPAVSVAGAGQPAGLPPPPAVSVMRYGNTAYGTGVVNGKPTGTTIPLPLPGTAFPPLTNAEIQQAARAGYEATGVGPDGVPILKPMEPPPQPKVQWQKDDTGKIISGVETVWNPQTRKYEYRRVTVNGDGVPDSQQPGGAPINGMAPMTMPSGVKIEMLPDQASAMQTGQMPNEAYASPLTPEQSLQAARDEYARTGNDTALRAHFARFPSRAAELAQQESAVWQQMNANAQAGLASEQERQLALASREAYIARNNIGPIGEGALALDWARKNPRQAAILRQGSGVNPNIALLEQANQLNAARTGQPMPASAPVQVPTLEQLKAAAEAEDLSRRIGLRQFIDTTARGAQDMGVRLQTAAGNAVDAMRDAPMALDRALLPLRQRVGPAVNQFIYGDPQPGPKRKAYEKAKRGN